MGKEMLERNLFWLAGVLEGDGCFRCQKRTPKNIVPRVSFSSVDEDVARSVASLMEAQARKVSGRRPNHKPIWVVDVAGEKAMSLMSQLSPLMGNRRSAAIQKIQSDVPQKEQTFADLPAQNELLLENKTTSLRAMGAKYGCSYEKIRRACLPRPLFNEREPKVSALTTEKTEDNLWWLAGFLEAEGSFMKGPPSSPSLPIVSAQTTDKDVAQMVADMIGGSVSEWKNPDISVSHFKTVFSVRKKGRGAIALMVALTPYMGLRRQGQIANALKCVNKTSVQRASTIMPPCLKM